MVRIFSENRSYGHQCQKTIKWWKPWNAAGPKQGKCRGMFTTCTQCAATWGLWGAVTTQHSAKTVTTMYGIASMIVPSSRCKMQLFLPLPHTSSSTSNELSDEIIWQSNSIPRVDCAPSKSREKNNRRGPARTSGGQHFLHPCRKRNQVIWHKSNLQQALVTLVQNWTRVARATPGIECT